jgi:integrase
MASVKPKGAGKWLMRWRAPDSLTGRPVERSRQFTGTKAAAQREAARLEGEQRAVPLSLERGKTFGDFLVRDWLPWREDKPGLTEKSRQHSRERSKALLRLVGNVKLADFSGRDLDLLAATLHREGRAASTVRNYLVECRSALRQAKRWRMLSGEPWTESKTPKLHRSAPKVLLAADAERLAARLDTYQPIAAALVRLAAGSGARVGELLALRWEDVSDDNAAISIHRSAWDAGRRTGIRTAPKTASSRRSVSLPAVTREALARYRIWHQDKEARLLGWSGGLLFPGRSGGLWRVSAAVLVVRRAQVALGLPTGMHALRHGHATTLIEAGVSVKAIAERLGHETPALVLSTYAHVTPVSRDAVLKALDQAMGSDPGAQKTLAT